MVNPSGFAIMAHMDRQSYADSLLGQLEPLDPDVSLHVDDGTLGCWGNARRAWLAHGDTRFHCVIQDDAILAPDFGERLSTLLELGEHAYCLFFRVKRSGRWAKNNNLARKADQDKTGHFASDVFQFAVGSVLPTRLIGEMVAWGDAHPEFKHDDDRRIDGYLRERGVQTIYPIPSLVDHRHELRSVHWPSGGARNRKATWF